jgi:hypothetical protein
MKRSLILTFLLLLLTFGIASAANNINAVNPGFVNSADNSVTILFTFENDVALAAASTGYTVNATGPATALWQAGSNELQAGIINPPTNIMAWSANTVPDTLVNSDSILMGGAAIPAFGIMPLPAGAERDAFKFTIALSFSGAEDTAEVCVDSVIKVGQGGDWLWDDGNGNINPTFNSGQGPTCFGYGFVACQPPIFTTVPTGNVVGDHCAGATFQFAASPEEPGSVIEGYSADMGTITAGGLFTFPPSDPGDYDVTIGVWNDICGEAQTVYTTITVHLTNSGLQFTNCPTSEKQISSGKTFEWDLGLDNFDCDPINYTIVASGGMNAPTMVGDVFTWVATTDDAGTTFTFTVTGDDGFGETAECTFDVTVTAGSTWGVRIAKIGDDAFVFQGHYAYLPIYLDYMGTEDGMGGFDFLIAYDASALTLISAELGEADACWEYFTYRTGPFGNCGGACPSGLVQLVAMREANDGPNHPMGCDGADGFFDAEAEIAVLKFFVTNDRTYECQYVPVYFYWMECGDNAISDVTGNDLYVSAHVYNINWVVDPNNPNAPYYELLPCDDPPCVITENMHVYGTFTECLTNPDPNKPTPIPDIDFFNGGVDIACADSIDARGDLNLNNVAHEIADAVLYTNYFIYGPSVFNINLEGQIAASDVNNDGKVLTVGDLVYLVRVLTGDAVAFTKLAPIADGATVRLNNGTVTMDAPAEVGAALFVFDGEVTVTNLTGMQAKSAFVDGQTRVIVFDTKSNSIASGSNDVLSIVGDASLVEVEVADYYGNTINTSVVSKVLPKAYALSQNYPNPFNPTTEIAMSLPEASQWTLDVYNIAGQLVKSFSGYDDAGTVKVTWDAAGVASGIYFYKMTSQNFVDTKKMVLMK